ncbi:AI-2E family transporter [Acidisoma cladoniae]|jgi:predicted PurR-regulated permease PerM|uniref:AI-2E family transporter n=1 Tax=Acidisoma cladoniae TaxID=3040935 RepID=UPI00254E2C4F|nr:AI-2E family transporter [Acidisoma sp. PAMC 29798]
MSTLPPPSEPSLGGTRPQNIAMGVLAFGLLLLALFTLRNFLSALAWAGIFAIALWPLYGRAVAHFGAGRRNILMPAVFTLGVALIFIVPLGLVGLQLAREADDAQDWIHDAQNYGIAEPDVLTHLPFGQAQVDTWWQENLGDPGGARKLVQRTTQGHVAGVGRVVGLQVVHRLTAFVFTLLTLFFLFREGHLLTEQMRRAATRAFGLGGERVGQQIIASVHGTVNGLVLVGLGEGVLLGIVYAIAGVPQATIFGVITAVAAMIPFAAPVVFAIASLLLIAQGAFVWGVAVFILGMIVTFVADHFVRPVLIGGTTKLPFIWVLLGILGGVEAWGLIGLFFGPAIMAALILIWREWVSD